MSVHFVNLTNGLDCTPREPHFTRIQSTWCEQKRWSDVLATAGADLLFHLATNDTIIVHDRSERGRITRALWQGVPWVRYACARAWDHDPGRVRVRNGVDVTSYFAGAYDNLNPRVVRQVSYFAKWSTGSVAMVLPCRDALKAAA